MFHFGHFILLSEPSVVGSPSHRRHRLSSQLFSGRKPQIPRRTRPIYMSVATRPENSPARTATSRFSPKACCPRVGACGYVDHLPMTGLHIQARPTPSCCSIPTAVHPEPSLSTFLPISPPPHSVSQSSPRFGSLFFISNSTAVISSSTVVIHPPIRALFNPNVIQSPVKWIWQLKILFLHLLSLDLLLSHQKN